MGTSNEADKVLRKVTMALLYGSLKSGVLLHVQMCTAATHLRFCHGTGHYCPADVKQIITCHFHHNVISLEIMSGIMLTFSYAIMSIWICVYKAFWCVAVLVLGCSWCICYVNVTHLVFDWAEKNVFKNCVRLLIKWCVFTLLSPQRN